MFDRGGLEEHLVDYQDLVSIVYGANDSPMDRICDIVNGFEPCSHFVRIDGVHPFFFAADAVSMLYMARENNLDVVKWCDDIPAPITTEVYSVDGYIRARFLIQQEEGEALASFRVHPITQEMLIRKILGFRQFKASWAHQHTHLKTYETAVHEVFSIISEALKKENLSALLKTTPAHDGFFRLTKE
jgi:spore coat polysaccharide biosynthesis protein SpsF (cytidylyltransferase family)